MTPTGGHSLITVLIINTEYISLQKFEETASAIYVIRPVLHRYLRSIDYIAFIGENIANNNNCVKLKAI